MNAAGGTETVPLGEAAGLAAELDASRIIVLALDIGVFDPLPPMLRAALSDEDQATAARFRFPADQQRCRLGRSMVRYLVGASAGVSATEVSLAATDHGKPYLAEPGASIHFNVSHSGDLVLVALGRTPLGVDVEQQRSGINLQGLAAACFSPAERHDIFSVPDAAEEKFFRYWACKEAWIKADGRGLSLPLVEFTLAGLDGGDCRVERDGMTLPWRVRPLDVRAGYAAALASTDAAWTVAMYTIA